MSEQHDIGEITEKIKDFCAARDWAQFHDPKNLAVSLQLESAEVLELFQWTQDNQIKPGKEGELAGELADVAYWLLLLADRYGIDLLAAVSKKIEENEHRYPAEKAKGNTLKHSEL